MLRRIITRTVGPVGVVGFYAVVASVIATLWDGRGHARRVDRGLLRNALMWYLMTSEAATVALNVRLIEQIGDDIASASRSSCCAPSVCVRVTTGSASSCPASPCACASASCLRPSRGIAAPSRNPVAGGASLVLAVACNLVAQHVRRGVLGPRRPLDLVPVSEARVRARRDAHPAAGAARLVTPSRTACRSWRWHTRRLDSHPATSNRSCGASVLARRRLVRGGESLCGGRAAPARSSHLKALVVTWLTALSTRLGQIGAGSRTAGDRDGRQRHRVDRVLGAVLPPSGHGARLERR